MNKIEKAIADLKEIKKNAREYGQEEAHMMADSVILQYVPLRVRQAYNDIMDDDFQFCYA